MQSLGVKYVAYFNKKYSRKGTLWQGRYKSSLVEDSYLLSVMKYIESLKSLKNSAPKNAQNIKDELITPHQMYILLASSDEDRAKIYSKRVLDTKTKEFIKNALNTQSITGSKEFIKKIETIVGVALTPKRRGRPKKNQQEGKKMYNKLVVLDKEQHKSLKVSPLEDLKFAKKMAFVPVLASEIAMVAETFPVVFTADENPTLVALTSLGGENLAINEDGKYITRYVPAFLRKYPFSLASSKENPDQKVILIDESASNVSKTKGKQLFDKDGNETEVLKNAIKFLGDYEKQNLTTQAIAKAIKEAGILEDREISIGEGEEKKVLIKGFRVVNKEKLNSLDDKVLADWVRKGIITFIDTHLKSLSNIEVLFKLASHAQQK
jgi:putative transposase